MTATYDPIATTTLGTSASSIAFNSIPNTFTDLRLVLVWSGTNVSSSVLPVLRFNNDSTTNYSSTFLNGNGTTASSARSPNDISIKVAGNVYPTTASTPVVSIIDVFSYAGSTNKTVLVTTSADNNGSGFQFNGVGVFLKTNAITSINLERNGNGDYAAGTTATLYGIKAE